MEPRRESRDVQLEGFRHLKAILTCLLFQHLKMQIPALNLRNLLAVMNVTGYPISPPSSQSGHHWRRPDEEVRGGAREALLLSMSCRRRHLSAFPLKSSGLLVQIKTHCSVNCGSFVENRLHN